MEGEDEGVFGVEFEGVQGGELGEEEGGLLVDGVEADEFRGRGGGGRGKRGRLFVLVHVARGSKK